MRSIAHAKLADERPITLFEKIIDRHVLSTDFTGAGSEPGTGIFVRADWRFIHEYYTGMCSHMLHSAFGRPLQLHEPKSMSCSKTIPRMYRPARRMFVMAWYPESWRCAKLSGVLHRSMVYDFIAP